MGRAASIHCRKFRLPRWALDGRIALSARRTFRLPIWQIRLPLVADPEPRTPGGPPNALRPHLPDALHFRLLRRGAPEGRPTEPAVRRGLGQALPPSEWTTRRTGGKTPDLSAPGLGGRIAPDPRCRRWAAEEPTACQSLLYLEQIFLLPLPVSASTLVGNNWWRFNFFLLPAACFPAPLGLPPF